MWCLASGRSNLELCCSLMPAIMCGLDCLLQVGKGRLSVQQLQVMVRVLPNPRFKDKKEGQEGVES
jgi:hypothetical protein